MMWGYGAWSALWMLLFWAGVVLLLAWAVRPSGSDSGGTRRATAAEVLAERYARGEIDTTEFRSRRAELTGK